jgi:hypothetical protein
MRTDYDSAPFWSKFDSLPFLTFASGRITPQLQLPLQLSVDPQMHAVPVLRRQISYEALLDHSDQNRAIALVGSQGSGKTTLMAACVRDISRTRNRLPLFVPLGGLQRPSDFREFMVECLPPGIGPEIFEAGELVVGWDGLNEIRNADVDALGTHLVQFQSQYPQHRHLLSTRPTDLPDWLGSDFLEVQVLPLPYDTVRERIREQFTRIASSSDHPLSWSSGFNDLVSLCQLPMIYNIVFSQLQGDNADHNTLVHLCEQRQKYSLYGDFLAAMIRRGYLSSTLTPSMTEHLLTHLAFEMEASHLTFAPEDWIETTLRELITSAPFSQTFPDFHVLSIPETIRTILRSPPLQAIHYSQIGRLQFGFLHQSFAEYYAGRHLESGLRARRASNGDSFTHHDLDRLLEDSSRHDWEIVRVVAASPQGDSDLVEYLAAYAVRRRRQDLLIVAAQCLPLIHGPSELLAADLQIRMLDAFKNWEKPFYYDLLQELGELESRHGQDPRIACVQDQIRRYVTLYCPIRPIRLRFCTANNLQRLALSDDDADSVNALYTLSTVDAQAVNSACAFIMQHYEYFSLRAKEQALATLKELGASRNVEFFLQVTKDPSASVRSKVIALNGIGVSGQTKYVSHLIDYYKSRKNPHRDSAGWSLQMLGRVAQSNGQTDLLERIKQAFWHNVENEPDNSEGHYLLAGAFYSFGIFRAREYTARIIDWATRRGEVPSLILEDLIFSLALMADPSDKRSARFLSQYLRHADPVVRLKAVFAVQAFTYREARPLIRQIMREDDFQVVKELAQETYRVVPRAR